MSERHERAAVCAFCSCCCTDLELVIRNDRITAIGPLCPIAEKGFLTAADDPPSSENGGAFASTQHHIADIISKLRAAKLPLFYIGGGISYEDQRRAVNLAKKIHACVDTPASFHAFGIPRALADSGSHLLTLGELRDRVNTLVFWGCDLARKYPRFWQRFVKNGRTRKIVNVNSLLPVSNADPVLTLPINPQLCLEILTQLRLLNQKKAVEASPLLHTLYAALQSDGYGCFIFDPTQKACSPATFRQAMTLIQEMNDKGEGRWFGFVLERGVNTNAAANALSLDAGYPGAVRFSASGAGFSSLEWSAESLIDGGETDLVIQIGQMDAQLQEEIITKIELNPDRLKYIVLDSKPPDSAHALWLPVRQFGVSSGGTVLRMDGVPVSIHGLIDSPLPELSEVLNRLAAEGSA